MMVFLLGLALLTGISVVARSGDPLGLTRVLLGVASALVFQLHVVMEGTRPEHWPPFVRSTSSS